MAERRDFRREDAGSIPAPRFDKMVVRADENTWHAKRPKAILDRNCHNGTGYTVCAGADSLALGVQPETKRPPAFASGHGERNAVLLRGAPAEFAVDVDIRECAAHSLCCPSPLS